MRLECVDCHVVEDDIETIRLHVRSVHQRELVFDEADYLNPTANVRLASAMLLHPELILSA